ncbi:MAG: excisionase family DNA-binding protein [Planctomycetota bacterium]
MDSKGSVWLTTGQAAKLCSVTPDTILKWIRKGRIEAVRTAGGHYRISQEEIEALRTVGRKGDRTGAASGEPEPDHLRCWEYLSENGEVREDCKSCVVYRVRAARCFQMASLGPEVGHARRFCQTSCEDCVYYRRVRGLDTNVLVVSSDGDFVAKMKADESEGMTLRFARNAYEASAAVETFLPAFAVVDRNVIEAGGDGLVGWLTNDQRVPGMKVILAVPKGEGKRSGGGAGEGAVVGVIEKPFGVEQIASVIRSFPVESVGSEDKKHSGQRRKGEKP